MEPTTNLTKEYHSNAGGIKASGKSTGQKFTNANTLSSKSHKAFISFVSCLQSFFYRTAEKLTILKLRDQLNFYLGDSNLTKDKFLRQNLNENT